MKQWLEAATMPEKADLARRAGTSVAYLRRIATERPTYARSPKAELAADIERVTREMHKETKGRLPEVLRVDIHPACRTCQYAERCLGRERIVDSYIMGREVQS